MKRKISRVSATLIFLMFACSPAWATGPRGLSRLAKKALTPAKPVIVPAVKNGVGLAAHSALAPGKVAPETIKGIESAVEQAVWAAEASATNKLPGVVDVQTGKFLLTEENLNLVLNSLSQQYQEFRIQAHLATKRKASADEKQALLDEVEKYYQLVRSHAKTSTKFPKQSAALDRALYKSAKGFPLLINQLEEAISNPDLILEVHGFILPRQEAVALYNQHKRVLVEFRQRLMKLNPADHASVSALRQEVSAYFGKYNDLSRIPVQQTIGYPEKFEILLLKKVSGKYGFQNLLEELQHPEALLQKDAHQAKAGFFLSAEEVQAREAIYKDKQTKFEGDFARTIGNRDKKEAKKVIEEIDLFLNNYRSYEGVPRGMHNKISRKINTIRHIQKNLARFVNNEPMSAGPYAKYPIATQIERRFQKHVDPKNGRFYDTAENLDAVANQIAADYAIFNARLNTLQQINPQQQLQLLQDVTNYINTVKGLSRHVFAGESVSAHEKFNNYIYKRNGYFERIRTQIEKVLGETL